MDEAKGPVWHGSRQQFLYIAQRTCPASGRDESRPYIPDGGHLLPLLPAAGEKCGLGACGPLDGRGSARGCSHGGLDVLVP